MKVLRGLCGALLLASGAGVGYAQNLDAAMIDAMGNNSLFTRWRPTSHFLAPAGWMNDPCAAMYDPTKDVYHLFYQWHPNHVNWGNISWGHAVSSDLITWVDVGGWQDQQAQALGTGPVGTYNGLGIFSGTGQPVNLQGHQDGTLLVFYTCVSKLPTGWTLPYQEGTEKQCFAISNDGGETWSEYDKNPIISSPPAGWNITGWRDPFFEPWPEMDAIIGQSEPHYYAVFGSGIKGVGSRIPLYSAPASDLTNWTFLGALWEPRDNETLGSLQETGTYAFNFEVSGFFSLEDSDGQLHYYVNMGTEGGNVSFHQNNHWALWNEGLVTRRSNGSVNFTPTAGGAADWGNLYALTSFWDKKNNRRVQWGWSEEDMGGFGITQQGYQGALALPRELFVHEVKDLVNVDGLLTTLGNSRLVQQSDGTFTAYTLGVRPLEEVTNALRNGSILTHLPRVTAGSNMTLHPGGAHMELSATFTNVTGPAGLTIAASPGLEEYTRIVYSPSSHTITVNRTHSSTITKFANTSFSGYFHPYSTANGAEDITMRVFLDGSIVEIYVNERFALTTRIYPSRTDSTQFGVYFEEGARGAVTSMTAYVGLMNIFPGRPTNSSSRLIYDTVEQTNNYTWWTGN